MRPVRLSIQALGPYRQREVIDFRDAVEAGLFGIYGPTGSGKSTIFSAMTFALFGESANAEQDAPTLRSDLADSDTVTEVEFVFDIGERRFVILRRPEQLRPKQRGSGETRMAHEAFLFDAAGLAVDEIGDPNRGKIIAEKKVREVDTAITDLLGYGPRQFRQIVLLPQGRFEAFLAAKHTERLEILRELFDVSLYRRIAARLKEDAQTAEREVREEREVSSRRLAAEGFESTDALAAGIAEAAEHQAECTEAEGRSDAVARTTRDAMAAAMATEDRFKAVEEARTRLIEEEKRSDHFVALEARIQKAESARALLEVERRVEAAAQEVTAAEAALGVAKSAAEDTQRKAAAAKAALEAETARTGEIDAANSKIEALERYQGMIDRARDVRGLVTAAEARERSAREQLIAGQASLERHIETRRRQAAQLREARHTEARRREILVQLSALEAAHGATKDFEKAERDRTASTKEVARLMVELDATRVTADEARATYEEAERRLSETQAVHLASSLTPGDPCPVCGATDHPDPATGRIAHAGLDEAFRDARSAREVKDSAAHEAERKLTAAQSILGERENRLAALIRPEGTAQAIAQDIRTARRAGEQLGPAIDIPEAEAELDRLDQAVEAAERDRDTRRQTMADAEREAATHRTRLDEMLSVVPEALRTCEAISVAIAEASEARDRRVEARDATARAATLAREAALSAHKDLGAAKDLLADRTARHATERQSFVSGLGQAGLSLEDFRTLKPAIDTVRSDREKVNEHRRALSTAQDRLTTALAAIDGQDRPDLRATAQSAGEAEAALKAATEARIQAQARHKQLSKLGADLAETFRQLEQAEARTGPLRNLATLFDGKNPQNLDLETFAIGAMFDQVLVAANQRLGPMYHNRYRLEREVDGSGRGRRGLGIQAFDMHSGKPRPTSTLSGGETFIAALALALGLADVVESASGKVRLDTIFIDEGFGSLDTEDGAGTLDQVLQVLGSIVSQNRAVGLISHVPLVQEAIPNGFYVRKGLGGSRIETRRML